VNTWVATLATIGTILSAAYALWLYRKVVLGALTKPSLALIKDLDYREIITLGPLVDSDHPVRHLPEAGARLLGGFGRRNCSRTTSARSARRKPPPCWRIDQRRDPPMPETLEIPALLPALPEIVLALGAMALLWSAHSVASRRPGASTCGDPAADLHRRRHRLAAGGQARHLWRQLCRRQLRPFPQAAGIDRIGGRDPDVHRLSRAQEAAEVRIFDPDPARHHRDDDAHLGG
jgi:hypothetical protein